MKKDKTCFLSHAESSFKIHSDRYIYIYIYEQNPEDTVREKADQQDKNEGRRVVWSNYMYIHGCHNGIHYFVYFWGRGYGFMNCRSEEKVFSALGVS